MAVIRRNLVVVLLLLTLLAIFSPVVFLIFAIFRPSSVLAQTCRSGDVNCDGTVNMVDIGIIVDAYGTTPPSDSRADLNHDNTVNIVDIGIVIDNYGGTSPTPTPTPGAGACGDGVCNGPVAETCSSCPGDCGSCNLNNRSICHSSALPKTNPAGPINNPYLPLPVGMVNELSDGSLTVRVSVLSQTEVVDGVPTRVIEERESVDGSLIECSYNYFVQAPDGTVCYYGEEVTNCSGGLLGGSWRAGEGSGNYAGIMMPAHPTVDMNWVIEDAAGGSGPYENAVLTWAGHTVNTQGGYTFTDTLYVLEDNGLSNKTYARGVGMVGDETISLTSTTLLP